MWAKRYLFVLALISIAFAPYAFAGLIPHLLYGKRIAGQVVDAETGKPIQNAYVIALWESPIFPSAFTGHNSREICYHAAVAKTGLDGQFEVAAWKKWSHYDVHNFEPIVNVYVPHYIPLFVSLQSSDGSEPVERVTEHYALTPFIGTHEERSNMLFRGLANHDCRYGGESQKALFPMLQAIYGELSKIAKTNDERDTLDVIARIAAKAALAIDPNGPAHDEEVQRFIRENLR